MSLSPMIHSKAIETGNIVRFVAFERLFSCQLLVVLAFHLSLYS